MHPAPRRLHPFRAAPLLAARPVPSPSTPEDAVASGAPARPAKPAVSTRVVLDALHLHQQEMNRYHVLSAAEENALGHRIKAGDESAVTLLVLHNLRFGAACARRYTYTGIDLADLTQEANIGLLNAARKFDPDRGTKFVTYAAWWIRQQILGYAAEAAREVRVPLNRSGDLNKLTKAVEVLTDTLGRAPTDLELAAATELTPASVRALRMVQQPVLQLDAPVSADGDQSHGERLALVEAPVAESRLMVRTMRASVAEALETLSPRDAKVITMYFGLGTDRARTLEEIGEELGITRERVRQLRDRSIKKLRNGAHATHLLALMEDMQAD